MFRSSDRSFDCRSFSGRRLLQLLFKKTTIIRLFFSPTDVKITIISVNKCLNDHPFFLIKNLNKGSHYTYIDMTEEGTLHVFNRKSGDLGVSSLQFTLLTENSHN